MKPRITATLSLCLVLASQAAFAQHAPTPGREVTTIQRHTDHVSNVGDFPAEQAPRPVARPTNGDVGSTGAVAERRPDSELRGSAGPAPGEIDMSRPIGAADVARITRAYEPRFRPCYDRARATQPALAGRINMRFVIARDGSLTNVDVSGLPAAPAVATCIRGELQAAHFPRPEAGTLPFSYGMNFTPPAPVAPPRGRPRAARPRAAH